MPDNFNRCPFVVLQPASTTPILYIALALETPRSASVSHDLEAFQLRFDFLLHPLALGRDLMETTVLLLTSLLIC